MAKGGKGGGVFNGPSKTGNPSGKGRGNNPARSSFASSSMGFGGGGGITVTTEPPSAADLVYDAAIAKMDAGIRRTHDVARHIRTARETLPAEEAALVEADLRATLRPRQSEMVSFILKAPESEFSKMLRGKR